jgi:SAM-dependent methyltransferase
VFNLDIEEYALLNKIEAEHWLYKGKREIVRYWIQESIHLKPADILIDVGCGPGSFLLEWNRTKAFGIDYSMEALKFSRKKIGEKLIQGTLPNLSIKPNSISLVVASDVLEHCEHDGDSLKALFNILRPGGVLVATVPALPGLWSDWDAALHHYRRYTKKSLLSIVPAGATIIRCAYINGIGLIPIFIIRTLRKLRLFSADKKRAEDIMLPQFINNILHNCFVWLSCRVRYKPPLGLSLLLILSKGS